MSDCRVMIVLTLSAAPCMLPIVEHVEVARIDDARSFVLADGRRVTLAGVLAPRAGEPLADEAHAHLTGAVADKTVGVAFDDRATDRHGALVAHVFVAGEWLQQSMVGAGLARVRTHADTARCAEPLIAAETKARDAKHGLWALPHYRVRGAADLDAEIGTFQIVEGKVVSVAMSKGRAFVNFGADYRTDFTLTISGRDLRRLAKDGLDPATWTGKQIRVRGWLSRLNGPEIELTHAAQIQLLD
jgi:endonuclease YncB( thermonuclease family)